MLEMCVCPLSYGGRKLLMQRPSRRSSLTSGASQGLGGGPYVQRLQPKPYKLQVNHVGLE